MKEEFLEAYAEISDLFECFQFLIIHRVPFEDWPIEIQNLCRVTPEALGEK